MIQYVNTGIVYSCDDQEAYIDPYKDPDFHHAEEATREPIPSKWTQPPEKGGSLDENYLVLVCKRSFILFIIPSVSTSFVQCKRT